MLRVGLFRGDKNNHCLYNFRLGKQRSDRQEADDIIDHVTDAQTEPFQTVKKGRPASASRYCLNFVTYKLSHNISLHCGYEHT